jgi:hypothetical protein
MATQEVRALRPHDQAIPAGAPADDVERVASRVRDFAAAVESALAVEDVNQRMSTAGVLVRIDLADRAVQPILLGFDTSPAYVTLEARAQRADVVLKLSSDDLHDTVFRSGELPLRILSGAVPFEGNVRKFLRVLPVLRAEVLAQERRGRG